MIDHDPRASAEYAPPSFDELVVLGEECSLVSGFERADDHVRFRVAGQVFALPQRDAELLLHGVLLGYFYAESSDDLTTAAWVD